MGLDGFAAILGSVRAPAAILATAVPLSVQDIGCGAGRARSSREKIVGDTFSVLCGVEKAWVVDSHRHLALRGDDEGLLRAAFEGRSWRGDLVTWMWQETDGLLARMNCHAKNLDVVVLQASVVQSFAGTPNAKPVASDGSSSSTAAVRCSEDPYAVVSPVSQPCFGDSPGASESCGSDVESGDFLADYGFKVKDQYKHAKDLNKPDTAKAEIDKVLRQRSWKEVVKAMYPPGDDFTEGFKTQRQINETVSKWLDEILADERSHRDRRAALVMTQPALVTIVLSSHVCGRSWCVSSISPTESRGLGLIIFLS